MHGHEVVRQLREQPYGRAPAAHMGAGAPLGGERAADQERALVEFGARLHGPYGRGRAVRHDDPSLHHRGLGPDPHQGGVGASAEQQAEAGDDHGLAGAGLAGHRGETG